MFESFKTKDTAINLSKMSHGSNIKLVPAVPRFEDAFVDILGGGPGGRSL